MKLFEDMAKLGGDITTVIQKIINDIYGDDMDDEQLDEIVAKMGLSDLIALDDAYSNGDEDAIKTVMDPFMGLNEYSVGMSQKTSAAAVRSKPAAVQPKETEPGTDPRMMNKPQTTRTYTAGNTKADQTTVNVGSQNQQSDNTQAVDDEGNPIEETVIDMVEWLKKKAGLV